MSRTQTVVAALSCSLALLTSGAAHATDDIAECVKSAEEAQSLRSAHQLRGARLRLLACAQTTCPAVVRADCAGWLSEVEKLLPSVVIEATDSSGADLVNVRVSVDGELLTDHLNGLSVAVDPGIHQFLFEYPGAPSVTQQVVIREGEKGRTLSVRLSTAPVPAPLSFAPPPRATARVGPPPLVYVFGGLAGVALGSFAYFGLTGRAEASDLADGCGRDKSCREGQVSPVRTKLLVADISLGVGLLSLGAGAYFLLADKRSAKDHSVQASVALRAGPGSVSVLGSF